MFVLYTVPVPSVMLRTGGRADGIILVDDTIVIFCDIELNGVLRGSDVSMDVSWFNGSTKLANSTRVILQGLTGDATDVQSIVILGPVQLSDVGTYECHVTLTPLLGLASPATTSGFINLPVKSSTTELKCKSPQSELASYGMVISLCLMLFVHSINIVMGFWPLYTMRRGIYIFTLGCVHIRLCTFIIHTLLYSYCVPGDVMCTSSGGHDTASVVGGILSLVVILISGVAALVIILLTLRIHTLTSALQ